MVRALMDKTKTTGKPNPAKHIDEQPLSQAERERSAALMRINHAGEICAQALYHGQSAVSKSDTVHAKMQQAALEEGDHLRWCRERLLQLDSHTSYLNPLWYAGSFCIGMAAGMVGDAWSLGFVAETERQVIKHLDKHLHLLPKQDERSQKILMQMEADEAKHRDEAIQSGARELPVFVQKIMGLASKVMVKTSYYL
jgi:ubiquinone biosynthesis monooxygenase Coq7